MPRFGASELMQGIRYVLWAAKELQMKILVVDDSNAIRTKLVRYLRELGHVIVGEAGNGFEAIEQFKILKPEVVTMDIVMPECDGLRALTEILKIDKNARIVMVTSAATVANMQVAKDKGAMGFVVKPFVKEKVEELMKEVERAASGRAA